MNHQTGNTEQRTTTAGAASGEDAKQKAQQVVDQTRENVKQKASELSGQARQKAGEVTEQAKEKASEAVHQAQQKAESAATDQKEQAANRLDSVAESLYRSGRELRDQDEGQLGAYVEKAATQIEGFSAYLHDRNINQLLNDVQGFAKQQPELFTVGALAAGFLVGRFFKSSSRSSSSMEQSYMGQSSYPSYSRREYMRDSYPGAGGRSYNRSHRSGVGQSRYPSSDFVDRQYESAQDEYGEYTEMQGAPYSRTSHDIPVDRPPTPSQAEGERSPGSTAGDPGPVGASAGTSTRTSTSSTGQSHSPDRDQSDQSKSGKGETGKGDTNSGKVE